MVSARLTLAVSTTTPMSMIGVIETVMASESYYRTRAGARTRGAGTGEMINTRETFHGIGGALKGALLAVLLLHFWSKFCEESFARTSHLKATKEVLNNTKKHSIALDLMCYLAFLSAFICFLNQIGRNSRDNGRARRGQAQERRISINIQRKH